MNNKRIKKFVSLCALFLASVMLLPACAIFPEKRESEYIEGQRLTVDEVEIEYTEEEIASLSLNLTNIASELIFWGEGLALNEKEKASMLKNIEEKILPCIIEANISYERAERICEAIEEKLAQGDRGAELLSDLYLLSMSQLRQERGGEIIYLFAVSYLESKAEKCKERYESYGYEWYLEDSERYFALAERIKTSLGERAFATACGIMFFTVSLVNGTPVLGEGTQELLDSEELLVLLKRQGEILKENELDSEQWKTVAEFVFEVFFSSSEPPEELGALERAEYLAIRKERSYAEDIGGIMPCVVRLYCAATEKMSAERLGILLIREKKATNIELVRTLHGCKNEFLNLAVNFGKLSFRSQNEKEAIESVGEYESFCTYEKYRRQVNAAELHNAMGQYVIGNLSEAELKDIFENYMFFVAPYFTYAFIFERK